MWLPHWLPNAGAPANPSYEAFSHQDVTRPLHPGKVSGELALPSMAGSMRLTCDKAPQPAYAASRQRLLPFVPHRHHNMRTPLHRLLLAVFLLSAFLTVQLAAAAYACEGSRYSLGSMEGMPGMTEACPDMAKEDAAPGMHDGLCQEHCQLGSKSADHATPQVPAFHPVLVNIVVPTPVPVLAHRVAVSRDAIPRAPPRPLPILNCCFRT